MEYVKLYVTLSDDPKVIDLSDSAFRAYVVAMCWSGKHETDGKLPKNLLSADAIEELRTAGLVDDQTIHNWAKYQVVHADLDAKRIAGRNAASIRWGKATSNTEVRGKRLEVRSKSKEVRRTSSRAYSADFEVFWKAFPTEGRHDKPKAAVAFASALRRASLDEIVDGATRYAADPNRAKTKYAQGWLSGDRWTEGPLPDEHRNGHEETTEARLRRLGTL